MTSAARRLSSALPGEGSTGCVPPASRQQSRRSRCPALSAPQPHGRPARGRPRPAPAGSCASTSCPRPGSPQRTHTPPRPMVPARPRRSPLPAPGRMVPARAHHLSPSQQSPPSPPRKYSAHNMAADKTAPAAPPPERRAPLPPAPPRPRPLALRAVPLRRARPRRPSSPSPPPPDRPAVSAATPPARLHSRCGSRGARLTDLPLRLCARRCGRSNGGGPAGAAAACSRVRRPRAGERALKGPRCPRRRVPGAGYGAAAAAGHSAFVRRGAGRGPAAGSPLGSPGSAAPLPPRHKQCGFTTALRRRGGEGEGRDVRAPGTAQPRRCRRRCCRRRAGPAPPLPPSPPLHGGARRGAWRRHRAARGGKRQRCASGDGLAIRGPGLRAGLALAAPERLSAGVFKRQQTVKGGRSRAEVRAAKPGLQTTSNRYLLFLWAKFKLELRKFVSVCSQGVSGSYFCFWVTITTLHFGQVQLCQL